MILTKTAGLMDLRTLQRLKIKERGFKQASLIVGD